MLWWTVWIVVIACFLGLIGKKKDEGYLLVQWHPMEKCPPPSPTMNDLSCTLVQVSSPWLVGKSNQVVDEKDEARSNTITTATVNVCDVFSETYWEACHKFCHAVH